MGKMALSLAATIALLATAAQAACPPGYTIHGQCVDDKCKCTGLWTGEACDEPLSCPNDCVVDGEKRGECVAGSGKGVCKCLPRYTGATCQFEACGPKSSCSGHGKCDEGSFLCQCTQGYFGQICEHAPCPHDCTGQGTCECEAGFGGDDCSDVGCVADCSGHGNCIDDTYCECFNGYKGVDCRQQTCVDNCNKQGKCKSVGGVPKCICNPGFAGPY